ncbi:hypothetical protein Dsin_008574 [Dipteronia sinensis]|uniref:non-specific serine/threonine protein kinase n=1 Tax=Dipteronia sinensis TaxID=43782 RepID=A0AAE0AQ33_9ROSI|nr:hypothetical protein Dsin_008574 [Dipteronia sinensis]
MKFYTSWVDTGNRNINFVTEMFTSGTLRQYRLKQKRVNIRAVKHWCRKLLVRGYKLLAVAPTMICLICNFMWNLITFVGFNQVVIC